MLFSAWLSDWGSTLFPQNATSYLWNSLKHTLETYWDTLNKLCDRFYRSKTQDQFRFSPIFQHSEVCKNFAFPKVKLICEPWRPPLRCCILATRKTAMVFQEQCYMLGCFFPVDEIEPWRIFQKTVILQGSEVGGNLVEFSKEDFWSIFETWAISF